MKHNGIANDSRQVFGREAALYGDLMKRDCACQWYFCGNVVPIDRLKASPVILMSKGAVSPICLALILVYLPWARDKRRALEEDLATPLLR